MLQLAREQRAGGGVPDAGRAAATGGHDLPAIGTKLDPRYRPVVLQRRRNRLAGGGIPDTGGAVAAYRGDTLAVTTEDGAKDWPPMD